VNATAQPAAPTQPIQSAVSAIEHEQLHVRVIALENLLIALLATASIEQLDVARNRAAYISPRPGATAHALTLHASAEVVSMVERAAHFRITMCAPGG
jgi:hypothetical protein